MNLTVLKDNKFLEVLYVRVMFRNPNYCLLRMSDWPFWRNNIYRVLMYTKGNKKANWIPGEARVWEVSFLNDQYSRAVTAKVQC